MTAGNAATIFSDAARRKLQELAVIHPEVVSDLRDPRLAEVLASLDVLITGWGAPVVDQHALAAMPQLRTIIHAAGTVKSHLRDEIWERGITVASAADANAIPVAEYTLGAILLAGKNAFGRREHLRASRSFAERFSVPAPGNLGRRVGVVGASRTGRKVMELLRNFDMETMLCDPFAAPGDAGRWGARLLGLDEMLTTCDVLTLHAPALESTRQLIDRERLARLRDGAVLINTARGSLVDTAALTAELLSGRISAVLDVTDPEPLPPDSPLYGLPNVFLTPHIAGSADGELARLGDAAVAELDRLVSNQPLEHLVRRDELYRSA